MSYIYRPAVFITGADSPTGLTTARALRGLDLDIIGLAQNLSAPTCSSNIWDKVLVVSGNPEQQVDQLLEWGKDRCAPGQTILLFAQDAMVIAASRRLEELRRYFQVPIPESDVVDYLMDKTRFHAWALEHGFSVPQSEVVSSDDDIVGVADGFSYPAILKPMVRTAVWDERHVNRKFFSVRDADELKSLLEEEKPFQVSDRYILQQWIDGGDSDVLFVLFAVAPDGRILRRVGGQKVWQWPPLGGSTALCQSCFDPNLLAEAERVILQSGLIGLASVEFKCEPSTGRLYITEPTVGRNDYQSGLGNDPHDNPTRALVCELLGWDDHPQRAHAATVRRAAWIDEVSCLRRARYMGLRKSVWQFLKVLVRNSDKRILWGGRRDWSPFRQAVATLSWGKRKDQDLIRFGIDETC